MGDHGISGPGLAGGCPECGDDLVASPHSQIAALTVQRDNRRAELYVGVDPLLAQQAPQMADEVVVTDKRYTRMYAARTRIANGYGLHAHTTVGRRLVQARIERSHLAPVSRRAFREQYDPSAAFKC